MSLVAPCWIMLWGPGVLTETPLLFHGVVCASQPLWEPLHVQELSLTSSSTLLLSPWGLQSSPGLPRKRAALQALTWQLFLFLQSLHLGLHGGFGVTLLGGLASQSPLEHLWLSKGFSLFLTQISAASVQASPFSLRKYPVTTQVFLCCS